LVLLKVIYLRLNYSYGITLSKVCQSDTCS